MDPAIRLDALVAPLRREVVSGASMVARMACDVLLQAVTGVEAESPAELRRALSRLGSLILDAQPAMAPLVALVGDVLGALDAAEDLEGGRAAAREAASTFRRDIEARTHEAAARTAAILPEDGAVLTLSSSATVLAALMRGAGLPSRRVIVLESRPLLEGHRTAVALAEAGVRVTVAVDAAVATLVPGCATVLLGADSVGDMGVVNKLGSLAAAEAARRAGVPVVVAADRTKILPPGFPQSISNDRPPDEVMRPRSGVTVWNRYFEAVPLGAITSVVTDAAVLTPAELERYRVGIRVPEDVRVWAAERATWADPSRNREEP